METKRKETISTRIISTCFVVLALAVFKPFGLETWHWQAYIHLLIIGALGIGVCLLTDGILKYLVKMPRAYNRGVSYIIRRNLWFQCINTPLVALVICLYRHFVLSDRVEANLLSWGNYFETLLIIAFCSFAIGLYWRFKFRSNYLTAELEETRHLNEQLQKLQTSSLSPLRKEEKEISHVQPLDGVQTKQSEEEMQPSSSHKETEDDGLVEGNTVTLKGSTSETITLQIPDLLYVEAVGNYVKVFRLCDGQVRSDMLRATSKQIENDLSAYPMIVRCHRAFLVNLGQVEKIVSKSGTMQLLIRHGHDYLPVSRSNMAQIKKAILQ